jgi:hypothetical protein
MFRNRVNPFGEIFETKSRGAWMGNRGLIHNEQQKITRDFRLKAWLICQLEFKGWHRPIMAPGQYTELFFFDEATAFAAGHRPCSECRREDFNLFKAAWLKGNPEHGFHHKTKIAEIDAILHADRMKDDGSKVTAEMNIDKLPNGTFILYEKLPWLVFNGHLHEWSPEGYKKSIAFPEAKKISVLTPASVVSAFRAGYQPQVSL